MRALSTSPCCFQDFSYVYSKVLELGAVWEERVEYLWRLNGLHDEEGDGVDDIDFHTRSVPDRET